MKKLLTFAIVGCCLALPLRAEQGPPNPSTPPHAGDEHRRDRRPFPMHFGGADETARILPPGPWWKDQDLAKRLELTADQQKRIEDTFLQSRIELIHMHASLEEEEVLLAPMLDANPIDQSKTMAQIAKIADTRAALEKSNAKMLLQIRAVLNQQQWTKLQQERAGMRPHMMHPQAGPQGGPRSFNHMGPDQERMRGQMHGGPGSSAPAPGDSQAFPLPQPPQ